MDSYSVTVLVDNHLIKSITIVYDYVYLCRHTYTMLLSVSELLPGFT